MFTLVVYLFVSQVVDRGAKVVQFAEVLSLFFFSPRVQIKNIYNTGLQHYNDRVDAGELLGVLRTTVSDTTRGPKYLFASYLVHRTASLLQFSINTSTISFRPKINKSVSFYELLNQTFIFLPEYFLKILIKRGRKTNNLLGLEFVELIDLFAHLRDGIVVLLAEVSESALVLDVGFLQVPPEFGELGFTLLVQLDLG